MAAVAVFAFAPRATRAVDQHRAGLERAATGAAVLALMAGVVALVWVLVRRWWNRTQGQVSAVLEARELYALSPAGFEAALAGLCTRDGCTSVQVVGGAGDQGADVLAMSPRGRMVVQAKRYAPNRAVGSPDVQRFGGTCFTVHRADIAVLITTAARFTPAAREYAQVAGIRLMDGAQLAAWRSGSGPPPWG